MTSPILIVPDKTLLPFDTSRGFDSPVKAMVFKEVVPSIMMPSKGIFSPF